MQFLLEHIGQAIKALDVPENVNGNFHPGIGPFGEPQLVRRIKEFFNENFNEIYPNTITRMTPDLLVPNIWALEFKIVRPFGDNGQLAENWSVNLLHPYPGNDSSLGDCYKLINYHENIRKGIIVITYEHNIPQINLGVLLDSFELLANHICHFNLSHRYQFDILDLIHPVHQRSTVYGWEIL